MTMRFTDQLKVGLPRKQGLYDPAYETENCGVGFVADIKGRASHQVILDADHVNRRMTHRGAAITSVAEFVAGLPEETRKRVRIVPDRELPAAVLVAQGRALREAGAQSVVIVTEGGLE